MAMDLSKFGGIVDDFRRVNPQDPGGWPVTIKIIALLALFLVVLGVGFAFVWKDQLDALDTGVKEEEKQKDDFVKKKTQAVNLEAHKQQLREIDQVFGTLLKQLPNKSEMDALIIDINQAGLGRGLQFEEFKPQVETTQDFFAELPIQIRVIGSYHDIGAFASDVSKLSRIVTLNNMNIQIATANKDPNILQMDTVAKTFRYLDEEEVAKARKNAKAAAAKK